MPNRLVIELYEIGFNIEVIALLQDESPAPEWVAVALRKDEEG